MSETELRAAAEYVTNHCVTDSVGSELDTDIMAVRRFDDAADAVARAWLADHPADSELPVDETWLRSAGFVQAADRWLILRSPSGTWHHFIEVISIDTPGNLQWRIGSEWNPFSDRGQVRRLCSALGIKLESRP